MLTDGYSLLRIVYRGVLLILLTVVGLLPTVLCQGRTGASIRAGDRMLDEFMINWWSGSVCRVFGVKVEVSGAVRPGPVLIVANHISWLDIAVLHSAASMSFVSKAEVGRWPVVGFIASRGGTVYLERGSHDSSSSVADAMTGRLKEGRRAAIFPEGGIRPGEGVKVFHARLFRIAIDAECPVQPVMLRYMNNGRHDHDMTFFADETFTANIIRLLGRPACRCELRFLDPIQANGRTRKELALASRDAVKRAFGSGA